jgi:hypothetical protein
MSNYINDTPRTDAEEYESQDEPITKLGSVDAEFARTIERELNAAQQRIKRLDDCLKTAWIIIADVGGDWTRQKPQWKDSVIRWRDNQFHPIMKELSERKAKEAKP